MEKSRKKRKFNHYCRNIKKSAQISAQVLLYSLGAIVLIAIIVVGFSAIRSVKEKGDVASIEQFKSQLSKDISVLGDRFGSITIKQYNIPNQFNKICFIDIENVIPEEVDIAIIKRSILDKASDNLFMFGTGIGTPLTIEGLKLSRYPYYYCINSNKIEIKLETKKEGVMIHVPVIDEICTNAQYEDMCDLLEFLYDNSYSSECCEDFGMCC